MANIKLLLLSNSRNAGQTYLEHALPYIKELVEGRRVLFIPYAIVVRSFDEYEAVVKRAFQQIGCDHLYAAGVIDAIRDRALGGVPYIGWSAGSNVACPTIKTTNDMPIVQPSSFRALGLVPFQINPHYIDAHPEGHQGETREERILEFVEVNAGVHVVGLREGSMLKIEGDSIQLLGPKTARVFVKGSTPKEYSPTDSLQFL
jgi:dipeptidase E